jgi:hypothetical protein
LSNGSSELEARLAELTESVRQIERRVAALERSGAVQAAAPAARRRVPAAPAGARPAEGQVAAKAADVTRNLSLGGRTLLVLAGAFVLRALTDAGSLPAWLGVALGFAYAGTWIAMAYLAGRAGRSWSAGFHGAAAVMIGFPLLFEATSRFKLLSPVVASVLLAAFTGVALGVAARQRLQALAWLVALGCVPTAVALMVVGNRLVVPALVLVLLGVATLWLGYVRDWVYLRWPIAMVADLVVVVMALRAVQSGSGEGPGAALLLQFFLMALYLGSIAARTLLLKRDVVPFEVAQTAAAIAVGLGGAAVVAVRSGMGAGVFGVASIALGVAAYAVAFVFLERQQKGRANFYFYSSVAIALVMAGTALVLGRWALALAWAAFAVTAGALGRRQGRMTLAVHAAVYAVAGAFAGGLLAGAVEAVTAPAAAAWTRAPAWSLLVLAALVATAWMRGSASPRATTPEKVIQLAVVATGAIAAAGILVGWLVPPLAGTPGSGASAGAVATVRTAVLVAGALLLAWAGRFGTWLEAGWLAYPLLAVAGLKILLEDLPRSRPATLFMSFAFYGAALILVPRLRSRRKAAQEPAGPGRPPQP